MHTLKRLSYIFLFLALLIIGLMALVAFLLETSANKKRRTAYGREAVSALAVDAALAFEPSIEETMGFKNVRWRWDTHPCVYTTNQSVRTSPNGTSTTWDNWPKGEQPSCSDFFVLEQGKKMPPLSNPQNCSPVLVWDNKGGLENSFVVLAVKGAKIENLERVALPSTSRENLKKWDGVHPYYYTNSFVEAGGFEGVKLTLKQTKQCDGFNLFRYQAEIENFKELYSKLQAAGYFVGLK